MTTKREKITTRIAAFRSAFEANDENAGRDAALALIEMALHDLCRIADALEQGVSGKTAVLREVVLEWLDENQDRLQEGGAGDVDALISRLTRGTL